MRRKLAVLLVIALLIGISGCSKKEEPASVAEVPPAKQDVVTVAETFVDFAGDNPVRISGNTNKQQKLTMSEGSYSVKAKTQDPFSGLKRVVLGSSMYRY
ncbi:MAG TPA: hypothetical protein DDW87_08650 [Firmicutes bacterium]|nr:hypothetical protein [Bacillota bacterium]